MNNLIPKISIRLRRTLNQLGLRKNKVFTIGFNKTGTSSLHSLYTSIGLPSYHGKKWRDGSNLKLIRSYDCFSDGIPSDISVLDRLYCNSKFILQVRNLDTWVYSRLAHIERAKKRKTFKGLNPEWDNTEFAIKKWIEHRNNYHLYVLSYFSDRPKDLLIVNYIREEYAVRKICNFLGYSLDFMKPHINANSYYPSLPRYTKMLSKCMSDLKIPLREIQFDIYCPGSIKKSSELDFPPDTNFLAAKNLFQGIE